MPYTKFDVNKIILEPLAAREHDMTLKDVLRLDASMPEFDCPNLSKVAERMSDARGRAKPVILLMGAHVIKRGLSRFVIDLMERGLITHVALNGAGSIHDFELAMVGATTESVAKYIRTGQFGMWTETGRLNAAARRAADENIGLGEAVGKVIVEENMPYADVSILAAGARLGIPVTVHVSIGLDIVHQHPNFDAAALGLATYNDFLIFTQAMTDLENGVYLNYGSQVMGPEVYLKALSMVRNVARQDGKEIRHFTTAVFDLIDLGDDLTSEAPRDDPRYYYRPYKTVLVRTVADGGESFYIRGDHRATMMNLWRMLTSEQR